MREDILNTIKQTLDAIAKESYQLNFNSDSSREYIATKLTSVLLECSVTGETVNTQQLELFDNISTE